MKRRPQQAPKNTDIKKEAKEVEEHFDDFEEVLEGLDPNEKKVVLKRIAVTQMQHSGPLPDAETFTTYADRIPNGGDRLMKQVENQSDHRRGIEKTGVKRSFNQSSTGQWMGFLIAIGFGLMAYRLIMAGHDVAGSILGSVDVAALVAIFVIKEFKKSKS